MQQVNLYTDAFRPKRIVLPLEQIILLPIVVLVLLIGVSFWLSHSLKLEEKELSVMETKNSDMMSRLQDLEVKAKKMRKDESLVAANQRLYAKSEARQQMIDVLDTVVVKDDEGFSNIMLSLARQKVEKLWLKSIYIGASGKEMHIEGATLNADLVPEYLQKLGQEDSFLGRTFTVFEVEQNVDESKKMNFALRSEVRSAELEVLLSRLDNSKDMLNQVRSLDKRGEVRE